MNLLLPALAALIALAKITLAGAHVFLYSRLRRIADPTLLLAIRLMAVALALSGVSRLSIALPLPEAFYGPLAILEAASAWSVAIVFVVMVKRYTRILCYRHQVVQKLDEVIQTIKDAPSYEDRTAGSGSIHRSAYAAGRGI